MYNKTKAVLEGLMKFYLNRIKNRYLTVILFFSFISTCLHVSGQAQHPAHVKFPHLSVQQSWVETTQPSTIEILAKFDLIQADLSAEQIQKIRSINPNAVILPFDSFSWDRSNRGVMVSEWHDNTGRPDVSDDCPVYQGNKIIRGVQLNGLIYQDWKAIVSTACRSDGFDGVYLDHWDNPWWGETDRYTVEEFIQGMTHIGEKIRNIWPGLILIGNPATDIHFSYALNGFMWEDYPRFSGSFAQIPATVQEWETKGTEPHILIINQRSKDDQAITDKINEIPGFWQRMRYATTMSMLFNSVYVMFNYGNGGSPHWANPWWFDEWDIDIGSPEGDAYQLSNTVYARKFTKGIILCNTSAQPQTVTANDLPGNVYYRFLGGQKPAFNNGKIFSQITMDGWSLNNHIDDEWAKPIGDGIILVKSPQRVVSDIIIDDEGTEKYQLHNNIQGAFSQNGFSFDQEEYGKWNTAWRTHGHNTCYFSSSGDGSSVATWTPDIGIAGNYTVYEWHPSGISHGSDVPFVIQYSNGKADTTVNQKINGGMWNSLGTYYFEAGNNGYVQINNRANGIVLADAVKFVYKVSNSNDKTPPSPPKGVKVKN